MKTSIHLKNKTPLDKYWTVLLVYMKVQTHSLLEPSLEYNKEQKSFTN